MLLLHKSEKVHRMDQWDFCEECGAAAMDIEAGTEPRECPGWNLQRLEENEAKKAPLVALVNEVLDRCGFPAAGAGVKRVN